MSILDTVLELGVGRRDQRHAEHRDERLSNQFRREDRANFVADRDNQRAWEKDALLRMRQGAEAAGIHPLAALGAQTVGPATSFQSNNYSGGSGTPNYPKINLGDSGAEEVNKAQAAKLRAETKLIDDQITSSALARLRPKNEDLAEPYDITPQTFTPVLDHAIFGEPIKSDPTVADAQAHTTRSGEAELYETLLGLVINTKDWLYNRSGLNWRKRMGANKFNRHMKRDNSKRYLKRTGKQYYRMD